MKTKGFCIIGVKESPEVGEESPEVRKSGRPEGNTSREVGELGSREVENTSRDRKTGRQKDRKTERPEDRKSERKYRFLLGAVPNPEGVESSYPRVQLGGIRKSVRNYKCK